MIQRPPRPQPRPLPCARPVLPSVAVLLGRPPAPPLPVARPLVLALILLVGLAAGASAGPILQEVVYDGVGSDADDVFTEIAVEEGFSLTGWSLQGINGNDGKVYRTISLTGMTVPTDGLLVLATASAAGNVLAARDYVASVDWQNGPDALRLLDPAGTVMDALQYGNAGLYNAGEGLWAPDVSAGFSLSRDAFSTDTGDNDADFLRLKAPSPGVFAAPVVPEPASLALMASGLGVLLGARRRRRSGRPDSRAPTHRS